ncbi:class I SAM-dependent methyltransferase family protein [Methanothermobacter wolfeii]|uniref:tRNA(Phe) (4-demethylwyosine(37)-C(7)) aminocarboxypropyltransferase n=1 Tax=Methanothermobacter wolfeii TaxID=145261 RepID=A0A9E7RSK3_METWO|nr:class I SAM-dependent methyltransferase family protein [Methanothermobacter wolfeii]UXH31479.1 class I SAM-dependent methyltransferase family protein [Methanothermobacter wolfeii]SCM58371.1 tRNA(Phe) (4-demethylwyosine(37)-C(7)) aminocarboxypropyltransferase {ECO:0000255/HAMAP-Rule:MF_01922} [Methanothermobacter wolfeii]
MKWSRIGDIVVVNREVDEPSKFLKIPGVRSVVCVDGIQGPMRRPTVRVLAGSGTETLHRENGCLFRIDLSKVMWSRGNINERARIPQLVEDGETVVDMFAGIGYFSIPVAVHANPLRVYSIEINPESFRYLRDNIVLNGVEDVVEPVLGDCREMAPELEVDRVIMGYVGTTHHYLEAAMECLVDGGVLHYHETVPETMKFSRPLRRIERAAHPRRVKLLDRRTIKKYSPGVWHVVLDARIG